MTAFLEEALGKLSRKSATLEETQQNKNSYLEIKMRQKEIRRKLEEILMKKKWILQATGYAHDTDRMETLWEEFAGKLADYDALLAEQIEHLKGLVASRMQEIEGELGKLSARTASLHLPASRQELPEVLEALKIAREEEDKLVQKIQRLRADCEQF